MEVVKEETENTWNIEKEKAENKLQINQKRQIKLGLIREKKIPGETLGIFTGNLELEKFRVENIEEKEDTEKENFVVYGNVEIDDKEK